MRLGYIWKSTYLYTKNYGTVLNNKIGEKKWHRRKSYILRWHGFRNRFSTTKKCRMWGTIWYCWWKLKNMIIMRCSYWRKTKSVDTYLNFSNSGFRFFWFQIISPNVALTLKVTPITWLPSNMRYLSRRSMA